MSTYPANFEQKSGFDKIRELVKKYCTSPLGLRFTETIAFSTDFDGIYTAQLQSEEMRQILISGNPLPATDIPDLSHEFSRLVTPGTWIEPENLPDLRHTLSAMSEIGLWFTDERIETFKTLAQLVAPLTIDPLLIKELVRIVDDKGNINDNASPELASIRKEIKQKESSIFRKLEATLADARKAGLTPENSEPTLRNGRLVIPILSAYKRQIKGFIHDESATGQTAYVEPEAIFETNNQIRELESAEKREIIKILMIFSAKLREHLSDLQAGLLITGKLDFIKAKARFGLKIGAVMPLMSNAPLIDWLDAIHPLLYLSHQANYKSVVPLNITLKDDQRILVISGPNAGGKSVALKTVALLQYMLQCGLPVSMRATSETGIFDKIVIDIGDEQSLENDLSTYSSHLVAMRYFIEHTDNKTLFLSDEIGTGTEPRLGGAIAEAIIEHLAEKGAFGVITTHYANLKLLAGKVNGVFNGAMLFDARNMAPLFRLQTGRPGSSFTFEIAKKTGFPEFILESAKNRTETGELSFEEQLLQLGLEKEELNKKRKEIEVADQLLADTLAKYVKLHGELEKSRSELIKKAKRDASDILRNANKLVENTIADIKEAQAEKEKTRLLREKMQADALRLTESDQGEDDDLPPIPEVLKKPAPVVKDRPLRVGDLVQIKEQDAIGELVAIKGKSATVSFDQVMLHTELKKLVHANTSEYKPKRRRSVTSHTTDLEKTLGNFQITLDVRGKRADEVIPSLLNYIDEASLLHIRELRVLHGKGNGVLRNIVRDYLKTRPEIAWFKDDNPDSGGAGITLIGLKQ